MQAVFDIEAQLPFARLVSARLATINMTDDVGRIRPKQRVTRNILAITIPGGRPHGIVIHVTHQEGGVDNRHIERENMGDRRQLKIHIA